MVCEERRSDEEVTRRRCEERRSDEEECRREVCGGTPAVAAVAVVVRAAL